jgi:glycine/D-amino acid oxidase-like deaminating enzyme
MSEATFVETIVVGAGLAGTQASRELQRLRSDRQILVLDSEESGGAGRLSSGLHFVQSSLAKRWAVNCDAIEWQPAKVRWDRNWLAATEVDFEDKDWAYGHVLPQWASVFSTEQKVLRGLAPSTVETAVMYRNPVRQFQRLDTGVWLVETPTARYETQNLIWAAGSLALQNALGKNQAQELMVANPNYSLGAADYRGGLALDWTLKHVPQPEEGFDPNAVFGIPVRFEGKLFLALGVLNGQSLRTLVHLPQEMLQAPKELLSFQKAVARTLKNVLLRNDEVVEESALGWTVSNRILGHMFGSAWALGSGHDGLEFVGDETLAAVTAAAPDSLGALESVNQLAALKEFSDRPTDLYIQNL